MNELKQAFLLMLMSKYGKMMVADTREEEKEIMEQINALYDEHIELVKRIGM